MSGHARSSTSEVAGHRISPLLMGTTRLWAYDRPKHVQSIVVNYLLVVHIVKLHGLHSPCSSALDRGLFCDNGKHSGVASFLNINKVVFYISLTLFVRHMYFCVGTG